MWSWPKALRLIFLRGLKWIGTGNLSLTFLNFGQFDLPKRWTFLGFVSWAMGLTEHSAMAMSWSPRPSWQATLFISVGLVIKNRSSIFPCRVGWVVICTRLKSAKMSKHISQIGLQVHFGLKEGILSDQSSFGIVKYPRTQILPFV